MITHPDTVVELATMRHLELLAACEQARLAEQAASARGRQTGILPATRVWFGSFLIEMGTHLQGLTETGTPSDAFGRPERAGVL